MFGRNGWAGSVDLQVEYGLSELCKFLTRQGLGAIVSYHVISGSPLHNQFFRVDLVFDEVISNIDMFGAPGGAEYSILFK